MHSPPGQQLAETMSGLQLTENVVQTECNSDAITTVEDSNQSHEEPEFPIFKLNMLHEKISSPRWVVPVLPEQELECLLQASIELCKKGYVSFINFLDNCSFPLHTSGEMILSSCIYIEAFI